MDIVYGSIKPDTPKTLVSIARKTLVTFKGN